MLEELVLELRPIVVLAAVAALAQLVEMEQEVAVELGVLEEMV
jgi:hypothetical protein